MSVLDRARLQTVLGSYQAGKADALSDASYLLRAQDFRRRLAGRIVALDREGISAKLPPDSAYDVSRKLDGEFTLLILRDGEAFSINPGGTVRVGLGFLEEARDRLGKAGVRHAVIAGELYVESPDRRTRVHDVLRATRQPDGQADIDALRFAAFDIVELDGAPGPEAVAQVRSTIDRLFREGRRAHPVEHRTARSRAEIEALYDSWVSEEGGEGLVIRSDDAGLFKVKPRHPLDVAVLGFTEGQDDREGLLHDLLVGVMRPEGLLQVLGRVGGGFTEEERRDWLSDLKDECVATEYTEVNEQVAYQMVRPERVIEISCLDLIGQNTRGATIDRMVLRWDVPDTTFRPVRRMPLCAPIAPQFVRLRDDKRVDATDIRLRQITDLIEVPFADRDASTLVLPRSQVLDRQVYTKVLKGQTLVRKLLLWKTNKEAMDPDFPAYVTCLTDFSPNRETPLKREIRVSSSREQIQELHQELAAQYVVRGWNPA